MKKIYLLCAAVLAAVGCHKEIVDDTAPITGPVVLTATVENDDSEKSKVGAIIDKENKSVEFIWTKSDAIAVQTASGFEDFVLSGEGGEAAGKFTGNASPVSNAFAVFPAVAAASASADEVTLNLPATYTYSENQTNALLCARVSSGNFMHFKHLAGIFAVQIKGVPAGSKFVFAAEGKKINGSYTVDFTAETPQVNVAETENPLESTVTVDFMERVSDAMVYIPLPVGEYPSWKAQLFDTDGNLIAEKNTTSTKTIGRRVMKSLPMMVEIKELFVTPNGAGAKNGYSWEDAMGVAELRSYIAQPLMEDGSQDDAQAHLNAAKVDGTTFYMSAGDYYIAGGADQKVKIEFSKYEKQVELTFIGGYPTGLTGASKAGRNVDDHVTAFTGNKEAGVFVLGNQTDVAFDGLTFKDASFASNSGAIYAGAGDSGDCDLTVTNCKIIDNKNTNSYTGAGIQLHKCDAIITDCYFTGNYARNGSCINLNASDGSTKIIRCTFEKNSTYNTSGAVQNGGKVATFENCIFKENTAQRWGGGAFHCGNSENTFIDCEFISNKAGQFGGAVSIEGVNTCTFTRCTFKDNAAENGSRTDGDKDDSKKSKAGGAIVLRGSGKQTCTFNACVFDGNKATNGTGGAIVCTNQDSGIIINAGTIFSNNTAYFDGGAIGVDGALTINGTSESNVVFSGNKTLSTVGNKANGGAIALWTDKSKTSTLNYVLFSGNEAGQESGSTVNYSSGGAIYYSGNPTVISNHCEFTANRARNGGCFSHQSTQTSNPSKYTDCNFHENICRSGANKNGTGGNFYGAVGQINNGVAEFERCVFDGNVVKDNSTVLHVNGAAKAQFVDCVILNNECKGKHACIKLEKAGAVVKMDRCLIKNNMSISHGMINTNANTMLYLNDVTFVDNKTTSSGSTWGICVHSGNANVCMNNVTSYNNMNTNSSQGSVIPFNSDGGWLITNSTIIDKAPTAIIRANGTRKVSICNNILINTQTANNLFALKSSDIFKNGGHNVMSCSGANGNASPSSTDLLSMNATSLAGEYTEKWTDSNPYAVYLWSNSLTGFTPATAADVYSTISAYTESDTSVGISNIGADFYNWLKTIGEVTESGDTKVFKDGRGETRTGNYWPGAYQAK